jgi:hypothetical protein
VDVSFKIQKREQFRVRSVLVESDMNVMLLAVGFLLPYLRM